ncbi:HAD family phosphatase [Paenibacillus sp. FSL P2-0089]|uniref:HAD family hydrolase n=1 Tax=unclassified Paenibacillus TaxID=185978 RepID=UPI0030F70051
MKNKLAIFDLDGTLFNTEEVNYLSYKGALEQKGYSLEYDFYTQECNGKFYKDYLPLIIPDPSVELMEEIHDLKKKLYPVHLGAATVNEHLFNLIELIKINYYVAVVTTASSQNCTDILMYFGKETLFELILTHNDVEKVKPDPEGFLKAMEHFNITPNQTIIFEDSVAGIEAAKRSGAEVLAVAQF